MISEEGETLKEVRLSLLRTRHNALARIEEEIARGTSMDDLKRFIAGWKASIRELMKAIEDTKCR